MSSRDIIERINNEMQRDLDSSFRPFTSGKKYQQIWMNDVDESPLKYYTKSQAKKLQALVNKNYSNPMPKKGRFKKRDPAAVGTLA